MHATVARFLLILAVPASLAAEACVQAGGPGRSEATIAAPPPQGSVAEPRWLLAEARARDEPVDLRSAVGEADAMPVSWATAYGHHEPYAVAVARARTRTSELDAAIPGDGGAITAPELDRVLTRLDAMTRAWATVFHAPDATMTDKLSAVSAAADASLVWSRRLDALGLHDTAGRFRAETRVGLSFEDLTDGPGTHWRSEGLALAKLCVTLARRDRLEAIVERCERLEHDYPAVTQRPSSRGCACDPGDPLCSSSMSGWCRPN